MKRHEISTYQNKSWAELVIGPSWYWTELVWAELAMADSCRSFGSNVKCMQSRAGVTSTKLNDGAMSIRSNSPFHLDERTSYKSTGYTTYKTQGSFPILKPT